MKNKQTAGILALLLGGLGIHRFYLGQNGLGLIYLLLSWSLLPAISGVIEAIGFFTMSDEEFNKKYNKEASITHINNISHADELQKLHDLKEKGIITNEEYEKKRQQYI